MTWDEAFVLCCVVLGIAVCGFLFGVIALVGCGVGWWECA